MMPFHLTNPHPKKFFCAKQCVSMPRIAVISMACWQTASKTVAIARTATNEINGLPGNRLSMEGLTCLTM